MSETQPNVYQKISAIISSLGLIGKDSTAPTAMGGYKFTSHAALLGHLRHELTTRNVVIRPSGEELLKSTAIEKKSVVMQNNQPVEKTSYNFHSIVKFNFTVVNGDDPLDFFVDSWIGEGMDTGDKGIQKAGTSAEKYYLMKLFKVGDKDDPDAIDTDGTTRVESQSAVMNNKPNSPTPYVPSLTPPAITGQAMQSNGELEKLVQDAGLSTPDTNQSELSPEELKNRLDALVWFGEQLPPSTGWFKGKVTALVGLWEAKNKTNTLTPEEKAAGSGLQHVFNQIAAVHMTTCGDKCDHILVPKLAFLMGGRITDPAKA